MKRLVFIFSVIALLNACTKLEEINLPSQNETAIEGEVAGTKQPEVLYASLADGNDSDADPQTRTYVENKSVLWHNGDAISYFASNNHNAMYQFNGEDGASAAEFALVPETGSTQASVKTSKAVYPYDEDVSYLFEDGVERLIVNYPSVQTYAQNSFGKGANLMVASGKTEADENLRFRNACGYFVIKLYGMGTTVRSITLSSPDGEAKIAGQANIIASNDAAPVIEMMSDATSSVTLECGGNGVALSADKANPTEFWFAIPPVVFENGLKVSVTDINGNLFEKQTTKTVKVVRNDIQPMAALEFVNNTPNANQLWYTRAEGNTKPLEFSNAFDAEITNHVYDSSKGMFVVEFSSPLTTIKKNAFKGDDVKTIECPKTLTTIEASAFYNSTITEFTFSGNVTYVGPSAFEYCDYMKSVTFEPSETNTPMTIEVIETQHAYYGTFFNCPLEYININRDFLYINNGTPYKANDTTKGILATGTGEKDYTTTVVIGPQLTQIYPFMFGARPITEFTIPAHISIIGNGAFTGCKHLTEMTIPASVSSIGSNCFYECSALHTINFEDSENTLSIGCSNSPGVSAEMGPFYSSPLKNIYLGRELKYINETGGAFTPNQSDEGIFYSNSYKKVDAVSVTIGKNVRTISDYMFNYLRVKDIVLPDGVKTIGKNAFGDCGKLTSIVIPGTVTQIGNYAFNDCSSLSRITFESSAEPLHIGYQPGTTDDVGPFYYCPLSYINLDREFIYDYNDLDGWNEGIFANKHYDNGDLTTEVYLGENVKTISNYMFSGVRVMAIWIPANVESIGYRAFYDCRSFHGVTLGHHTPPVLGKNAFEDCKKMWYISVPKGTADTYKQTEGWNNWINFNGKEMYYEYE